MVSVVLCKNQAQWNVSPWVSCMRGDIVYKQFYKSHLSEKWRWPDLSMLWASNAFSPIICAACQWVPFNNHMLLGNVWWTGANISLPSLGRVHKSKKSKLKEEEVGPCLMKPCWGWGELLCGCVEKSKVWFWNSLYLWEFLWNLDLPGLRGGHKPDPRGPCLPSPWWRSTR